MSDLPSPADAADLVEVDIAAWVAAAANDPTLHRDRQVTEIVLTAIGLAPSLSQTLVLKGGTLMALAFSSLRLTGDVDFTATVEPEGFDETLTAELNALLPRTAIQLGYLDLVCRVQTVKKMPKARDFADHAFPALLVRIGSARRDTPEAKRLEAGAAPRVLDVEISFRDQVYTSQDLRLTEGGVSVRAFSLHELVAEKLRALLQQPGRNRYRRQDVYDIAFLLERHPLTEKDRAVIHSTLVEKCATRGITATAQSLEDPEVRRRAEADWDSLKLELEDLPPFDACFAGVVALYAALPWPPEVA